MLGIINSMLIRSLLERWVKKIGWLVFQVKSREGEIVDTHKSALALILVLLYKYLPNVSVCFTVFWVLCMDVVQLRKQRKQHLQIKTKMDFKSGADMYISA